MQIKAKKQLRIELDNADMLEAVSDLLAKHGHKITAEELAEVKFVNSVKDGLRATLSITEETNTDTDEQSGNVVVTGNITPAPAEVLEAAKEHIAEVGLAVVETPAAEPTVDEPGQVEPSTVDDVALAHLDAQKTEEAAPVANEEEGEVQPTDRKSLFL